MATPKIPASITRILNVVRPRAPGAIDDEIRQELFEVFDEWCQNTSVWQERIPFEVEPNVLEYTLVPTGVVNIVRLMWVVDTIPRPVRAVMHTPGCITLTHEVTNAPDLPQIFTGCLALTVADPVNSANYPMFPAHILNRYRAAFIDGILGRLMSQVGKPYSSSTMAVYHSRRFRNAMAMCRADVIKANVYGGQNWHYPQQFHTMPRHGSGSGGFFGGPV